MSQANSTPSVAERYASFVISFRWPIMLILLLATVYAATQVHKLDMRNDPDTLLPESNRYVATNAYGEHKFGMGNLMVWGFKVKGEGDVFQPWFINMVQDFHERVSALPHANVPNFIDLAAQKVKYMGVSKDGGLEFKRLIPVDGISTTDPLLAKKQLAYLEKGLRDNPAMGPMLLHFQDKDGNRCEFNAEGCSVKATFIIGDYSDEVKDIYLPWVRSVNDIVEEFRGKYGDRVEFLTAGEPYFLAYMLLDLVNKWWLFVISIVIVLIILWLEFRDWRGALFPMLGVGSTIALTLGAMGWTEFKLTTMMVLTPMLLLAIGIGHSVQITRRFLQEAETTDDMNEAARGAIAKTIVPATLSIITDMVGFATLALVDISFYKAYAYFGMFGMLTLLLTTTTLIPMLMIYFPPKKTGADDSHNWEHKFGGAITTLLAGPGKWIPIGFTVAIIAVSVQITGLIPGIKAVADGENTEFDIMPKVEKGINYSRAAFKEESPTIQELEELGNIMPGVISVNIPVRGKQANKPDCVDTDYDDNGERINQNCFDSELDPIQGVFNDAEVLKALSDLEDWMRANPYIGFTGSYVQFIKLVNMLMSSPEGEDALIELFGVPSAEFIQQHWDRYKDPEDPEYVPDPSEIVQMYNGLLEANTSAGDLDSFVDTNSWNEGIVMGFVNTMDPVETHLVTRQIQDYLVAHKDDPGMRKLKIGMVNGEKTTLKIGDRVETFEIDGDPSVTSPAVGGFLGATEATRDIAMSQWLQSPLTTALAIFVIASLMFRSLVISGVLVMMLLLTLMTQYGLGAYFTSVKNWSGNLAFHTQVSLSISMGLGVDYGIYMFSRLREEMAATGGDWQTSLRNTLSTTGSAVIVSVIVLLGSFIPLLNTELANTWALGVYISFALIIDVIAALTLLPIIVGWLKPKWVFNPDV